MPTPYSEGYEEAQRQPPASSITAAAGRQCRKGSGRPSIPELPSACKGVSGPSPAGPRRIRQSVGANCVIDAANAARGSLRTTLPVAH